jgi:hypothetical protein
MKLKSIKAIAAALAAVFVLAGIWVSCSVPSGAVVRSSPELRLPLGWVLGSQGTEMGKMTSKFLNADTIKENLGSDMAVDVLSLKGQITIDGTEYNGAYNESNNDGVQTYVIKYKGFTGDISGMFQEFDLDEALISYGSNSEIIQPPPPAPASIDIPIDLPDDLKTWVTSINDARLIIKCTYESAARAGFYAGKTDRVKFGNTSSATDNAASAVIDSGDDKTVIFTSPAYTIDPNNACAISFAMDPLERYKVALDLDWESATVNIPTDVKKVGDLDFTGMLDQLRGIEFVSAAAYLFIHSPNNTFTNNQADMRVWVGDSSGTGTYLVGDQGPYAQVPTNKAEMSNTDWQTGLDIDPDASFDIPSSAILNLLKTKGSLYYQFGSTSTVNIQNNSTDQKFSFSIAIVLPLSFAIPNTMPLVTIGSQHYRKVDLEELNNFKSDFDLNKLLGDYGELKEAEFIVEEIKNDSLPRDFALSLKVPGGQYQDPIIIAPGTQEQQFTLHNITEIPEFVFIVPCDGNLNTAPATFSIPPVNPDPGFIPQFDLKLTISAKAQVEYEL